MYFDDDNSANNEEEDDDNSADNEEEDDGNSADDEEEDSNQTQNISETADHSRLIKQNTTKIIEKFKKRKIYKCIFGWHFFLSPI